MTTLNTKELAVLHATFESQGSADDWTCFASIKKSATGFETNELKGYLSDLQSKGLVECHDGEPDFDGCMDTKVTEAGLKIISGWIL